MGISSPLGIAGVILIIIGIIMALIGIIFIIINQNESKAWYIWGLLITGIFLAILGNILLAIALSRIPIHTACSECIACI